MIIIEKNQAKTSTQVHVLSQLFLTDQQDKIIIIIWLTLCTSNNDENVWDPKSETYMSPRKLSEFLTKTVRILDHRILAFKAIVFICSHYVPILVNKLRVNNAKIFGSKKKIHIFWSSICYNHICLMKRTIFFGLFCWHWLSAKLNLNIYRPHIYSLGFITQSLVCMIPTCSVLMGPFSYTETLRPFL